MLINFFYFIVFGNKRGIWESDEKKKKGGMWDFREKGVGMLDPSSETRKQIVGARESLNGRKKMARRKVKYGDVLYFSSRHFLRKFSLRKSRSRSRSRLRI